MAVRDADLKLLRVFETVVRCGGFSAAQTALDLSGSRISEYMTQLETRTGVRLCDRGRAGFRLTQDGVRLHQAAQRLLGAVDTYQLETAALRRQLSGVLRFGVIEATLSDDRSPLLSAIRNFMDEAPDVEIQVVMDTPAGLERRVLDGSLHLALGPFPERSLGVQQRTLYREDQFLYCAPPHPLCASIPGARQDELVRRSRFVARTYLDMQELKLLQIPASATIADNVEGRALLILSGNHIGFLPAHYAAAWEQAGRLKRVNPRRMHTHLDFKIIWRKDPQPARVVRSFVDRLLGTAEAFAPRGAGA